MGFKSFLLLASQFYKSSKELVAVYYLSTTTPSKNNFSAPIGAPVKNVFLFDEMISETQSNAALDAFGIEGRIRDTR